MQQNSIRQVRQVQPNKNPLWLDRQKFQNTYDDDDNDDDDNDDDDDSENEDDDKDDDGDGGCEVGRSVSLV